MTDDKIEKREKLADNVILVSFKEPAAYILTGYRILKDHDSVILKARGKNINALVNIAENLKREHNLEYKETKISSGEFKTDKGRNIWVSELEVELVK
jgi:DNA-binding protein Alba